MKRSREFHNCPGGGARGVETGYAPSALSALTTQSCLRRKIRGLRVRDVPPDRLTPKLDLKSYVELRLTMKSVVNSQGKGNGRNPEKQKDR